MSVFFEREGLDPLVARMAHEWLMQYVQLARVAPELAGRLKERPEEFEMVPVPRQMLIQLAATMGSFGSSPVEGASAFAAAPMASGMVLGASATAPGFGSAVSMGAPTVTDPVEAALQAREIARAARPLAELLQQFLTAIEDGEVDKAASMLSEGYLSADGDDTAQVKQGLQEFVSSTKSRRIVPVTAQDIRVRGNHLHAVVVGAVEYLPNDADAPIKDKLVLEIIFRQDGGNWKIDSLRAL